MLDGSLSTSDGSSDEKTTPPIVTSQPPGHRAPITLPVKERSIPSTVAGSRERKRVIKSKVSEKENASSVQGCGDGRVQRRQTGVKVVRERGKRGGKMTTIQEDREVKTQLVMEAQKEDSSQNGKVSKSLS